MGKIKRLSDTLIPKIAAGEVVTRPACAVKELLENSLDAGATEIIIEIEKAGIEKIKIIDNGEGMDKDDLLKCFLPHTTSKISKLEHLNEIVTLGFRGEALSSICAVSKTTIKSKPKEADTGYELKISKNEIEYIKQVGMENGTIVEINNLFYNVPARKKFLKSPKTEFKNILDIVIGIALAHYDKKFKLIHNKKIILNLPKNQILKERLVDILGVSTVQNLIEIKNGNEYLKIVGFVSNPREQGYTKENQFLMVNKRVVKNRLIEKVIKNSYGKLISSHAYPTFVLFLDLMPSLVNVNIHPQKQEVNFWNDQTIYDFVKSTISAGLEKENISYSFTDYFGSNLGGESFRKASKNEFLLLKDSVDTWNTKGIEKKKNYTEVLQIANNYLVANFEDGFVIADQHAAHESILYEQYSEEYKNKKSERKLVKLKKPVIIEFSTKQGLAVEENLDILNFQGFEIEPFGKNTFKVSSVPELFKSHNLKNLLVELLHYWEETKNIKKIDEKSKQTLAFLACRGAIKAGEKLTNGEIRRLLQKLEESKSYLTCPHGRPTRIIISKRDLDKLFKRI